MIKTSLFTLLILSASLPAQTPKTVQHHASDPCKTSIAATTTPCINEDSFAKEKRAIASLNKLLIEMNLKDSEAQRAWIKYRQLECEEESAENQGGSIYAAEVASCWTDLTNQRIKTIKNSLSYIENHNQK